MKSVLKKTSVLSLPRKAFLTSIALASEVATWGRLSLVIALSLITYHFRPASAFRRRGPQVISVLIIFLISYYLSLITFVPSVYAQNACQPPDQYGDEPSKVVFDQFQKCAIQTNSFDQTVFSADALAGLVDGGYLMLFGQSLLHPDTNPVTEGTGALNTAGATLAGLYGIPPASGVYYLAEKIQQFNPVQPAYAQTYQGGIGFSILGPTEKIWSGFRNASYVGFIIVFVITGFMIMFRSKISPQTVATIQDSLPRIIVALVLVTFSYAIVGLMIDIMFVILNFFLQLMKEAGLTQEGQNVIFKNSVFGIFHSSFSDIFKTAASTVAGIINDIISGGFIGKIVGFAVGGLLGIIAGIALLFVMIRVFMMLLMAYISIILLTIFAPFIFLFQALPGQAGAKDWFKQVAANLSVFPTVALMIVLAGILGNIKALGGGAVKFGAGDIGVFPLMAGIVSGDNIGKLIAFGLLFMTPAAAKIVKERIGIKEGGALGMGAAAAAGALGAGAAPFQKAGGAYISPYKQALSTGRYQAAAKSMGVQLWPSEYGAKKPGEGTEGSTK